MHRQYNISIAGAVQGTGFRPFVYRIAKELGLKGYVQNTASGVYISAEGDVHHLDIFLQRLQQQKPAAAVIKHIEHEDNNPAGYSGFEIADSVPGDMRTAGVMPDIAICPDCLKELFDPEDRRYQYPFINCTHCGPRFSIIRDIPYDRQNTSMAAFEMCSGCTSEYHDPENRRFHAQPNACPVCGPQLALWDENGVEIADKHQALLLAAKAIREGKIIALKGLGGFQLICDARNGTAIAALRSRKKRPAKPFALMYPDAASVAAHCEINEEEQRLLVSAAAPVVLLRKKDCSENDISPDTAPGNPSLGVMLPCTPLHCLLMHELGFPVVATSGNRHDEPICTEEAEALERLAGLADMYLVHNRPIVRPVDDSVTRVICGKQQVLRRARGYAPSAITVSQPLPAILAVGGHLKNTAAIARGDEIILSQHIGNLETGPAFHAFKSITADLQKMYGIHPEYIACDMHPDYVSAGYARQLHASPHLVQHHYAHVLACMADNGVENDVLGVCWDGTGYGLDDTMWGSEFLAVNDTGFERFAHFRYWRLPGSAAAIRQPKRNALGLLYAMYGPEALQIIKQEQLFNDNELSVMGQMLEKNINTPETCSAGRLFDAVASLTGTCHEISFEGEAAIALENIADAHARGSYDFKLDGKGPVSVNWKQMIEGIFLDKNKGALPGIIAAKFHNTLVNIISAVCMRAGKSNIMLTGGCFMNGRLTELAVNRLTNEGFNAFIHRQVPPNDGGISAGQVIAVSRSLKKPGAVVNDTAAPSKPRELKTEFIK